jgi:hypothetical protein
MNCHATAGSTHGMILHIGGLGVECTKDCTNAMVSLNHAYRFGADHLALSSDSSHVRIGVTSATSLPVRDGAQSCREMSVA